MSGAAPALADDNHVTLLDRQGRGDVSGEILVPLLITIVLLDVMEVIAANNHGSVIVTRQILALIY
jgi:hypothetical protein